MKDTFPTGRYILKDDLRNIAFTSSFLSASKFASYLPSLKILPELLACIQLLSSRSGLLTGGLHLNIPLTHIPATSQHTQSGSGPGSSVSSSDVISNLPVERGVMASPYFMYQQ